MNWTNVGLIFKREIRDQLRDRRTLFMVAILPILLYPAMGIGMMQMTIIFSEQPRTVVLLGADDLPKEKEFLLLSESRFLTFTDPRDAKKLRVFTDADVREDRCDDKNVLALVAQSDRIRHLVDAQSQLEDERTDWEDAQKAAAKESKDATFEPFPKLDEIAKIRKELARKCSGAQVVIVIPKGFGENIKTMNRQLAAGNFDRESLPDYERPKIVQNSADEKSLVAYRRVKEAISSWEEAILKVRLKTANLPGDMAEPVKPVKLDLAEDEERSALMWSKIFPAILVLMAVTGAFYPAVDLAAGEKERGTMETLLICPASRSEIVMGKFFTVMIFSVLTAILNLLSMGITSKVVASGGTGAFAKMGSLQPPPIESMLWIVALLIPLSALFSALCLALATFARSTKEGQYYLTPLLMVALGLTLFCLAPGIEINLFYSMLPVVGAALLLKEVLADPGGTTALVYAVPVFLTSIVYSLFALWWAIDQFSRETVLFREAERFSMRLWLRHLMRDKEPTPTFAEGGICFAMIMLLQFAGMSFLAKAMIGTSGKPQPERMMQMLMVQQLVIIAFPALVMGIMLTTNVRRTFRLRLPSMKMLGIAVILPPILLPLSLELGHSLRSFFPPLDDQFSQQLSFLSDGNQPIWLVLLAVAAAPAICEELAFRGFILSGFNRSKRTWLAICLSALTFGVMHMIAQQVFNAALLGLVLGLIAIRSGSILPGILFHFLWNAMASMHGRVSKHIGADVNDSPWSWLVRFEEEALHFNWPVLLTGAVAGFILLRWLIQQPTPVVSEEPAELNPDEAMEQASKLGAHASGL